MMNLHKTPLTLLAAALFMASCTKNTDPITITDEDFHSAVDKVTEVMVHDIFSPPVVSRIYVYPNIAAYEIIAQHNDTYRSLAGQVNGLPAFPEADAPENVNYRLAALIAHINLSKRLIFSEERMQAYIDSLYRGWKTANPSEFEASKAYGLKVVDHIAAWMDQDNYKQTRTMSKFTVDPGNESRWQPTPPAYIDGIEPHWNKIRPFVLDSAAQFKPKPPVKFSMDEGSDFYR
ncbi:MAG: phosphatidic acid phosphatase, partial [Sinomicrobium sp.]|nr:phosphatidic acid phosphatase [Sinomicrobium sp.]